MPTFSARALTRRKAWTGGGPSRRGCGASPRDSPRRQSCRLELLEPGLPVEAGARPVAEELIIAVGLEPVFIGDAKASSTVDALMPLWFALVRELAPGFVLQAGKQGVTAGITEIQSHLVPPARRTRGSWRSSAVQPGTGRCSIGHVGEAEGQHRQQDGAGERQPERPSRRVPRRPH
jgi:hypothetical protein